MALISLLMIKDDGSAGERSAAPIRVASPPAPTPAGDMCDFRSVSSSPRASADKPTAPAKRADPGVAALARKASLVGEDIPITVA